MTIQELQSAIRVAEDKLDELNSKQSNDWDVDVDEDGPFIVGTRYWSDIEGDT